MDIIVTGRVQGVGFRAGARHRARQLQLTGWIQNEANGTVRCAVEGETKNIELFIVWLKKGSFLARVLDLSIQKGNVVNYQGFEIRRSAL